MRWRKTKQTQFIPLYEVILIQWFVYSSTRTNASSLPSTTPILKYLILCYLFYAKKESRVGTSTQRLIVPIRAANGKNRITLTKAQPLGDTRVHICVQFAWTSNFHMPFWWLFNRVVGIVEKIWAKYSQNSESVIQQIADGAFQKFHKRHTLRSTTIRLLARKWKKASREPNGKRIWWRQCFWFWPS